MLKVPERHYRWDGSSKQRTKDCGKCEWYRQIRDQELCGWGVAFKVLSRVERERRCEIRSRELDHIPSAVYLDEVAGRLKRTDNPREVLNYETRQALLDDFAVD